MQTTNMILKSCQNKKVAYSFTIHLPFVENRYAMVVKTDAS